MPTIVKIIGGEGAATIIELIHAWAQRCFRREHARIFGHASALFDIARAARGDNICP